jgi:hypothetical protein
MGRSKRCGENGEEAFISTSFEMVPYQSLRRANGEEGSVPFAAVRRPNPFRVNGEHAKGFRFLATVPVILRLGNGHRNALAGR